MTRASRLRHNAILGVAVVGLLITLVGLWYYLLKPWPGVESSNDWTLVKPPASGVYESSSLITWTKPKVCVPQGVTTVQFLLRADIPTGTLDSVAYTRIFTVDSEYCREPNFTTIRLPEWIPSGTFRLVLRACTDTPNPRDTCVEVAGPTFTVKGEAF